MNIQDLGAAGEFIGSFLILATLVYLAIQTRQSKEAAEVETVRMVVADFNAIWVRLADDKELSQLVRLAVNDWESIGRTEQQQVHALLVTMFLHWVSARRQSSTLKQLEGFMVGWEDNLLGLITSPGGSVWFSYAKHLFRPSDIQHLESRLAHPDGLPPPWIEMLPWTQVDPSELKADSS